MVARVPFSRGHGSTGAQQANEQTRDINDSKEEGDNEDETECENQCTSD
jgi:hypothetical protein